MLSVNELYCLAYIFGNESFLIPVGKLSIDFVNFVSNELNFNSISDSGK